MCHCVSPIVTHHRVASHQPLYQCASCGRMVRSPIDCCARPNFQSLQEPGIFHSLGAYLRKVWHNFWPVPEVPTRTEEPGEIPVVEDTTPLTVNDFLAMTENQEEREEGEETLVGVGTSESGDGKLNRTEERRKP